MKICKRCESLNWDNAHTCVACGCGDLAELEEEPTPHSALLLVWGSRPQALSNAEALDTTLKDIYPDMLEDTILMAALHKVLPSIDFNNPDESLLADVRWTLLNGRRPFPDDVVSDVLNGIDAILSIKRGDVPTHHELDGLQAEETKAPKVRDISLSRLQAAAKRGDANAQYELGNAYYYGTRYTPIDNAEALRLLRQAAEQGHAEAQYKLFEIYNQGDIVEQDDDKARNWLQLAAEQGHPAAQFEMGNAYYYGDYDTPADDAKAVYWWRQAAEQGHAEAQYELGELYLSHDVVRFSPSKAKHWLRLAADQGYRPAQEELRKL